MNAVPSHAVDETVTTPVHMSEEEVIWLAYGTTVWCSLLYTIDTGKSLCAYSESAYQSWRMGRRWWGNSINWGLNNRYRSCGWRREWASYNLSALGIGTSFQPSQPQPSQSQSVPSFSEEIVIDAEEDDIGHDELDDEVYFGQLRGNIVGIQYYRGIVNKKEMVALVREPRNPYDSNAIKVNNVDAIQVGHIKRELAKPLAYIIDRGLARLEGIVPFGQTNVYTIPVDITLWGKPEKQAEAVAKLKQCGYYLTGGTPVVERGMSSSQEPSSSQAAPKHVVMYAEPRRTYLTPAEVKNELDKLFENIKEGDKTSITDPAQAIVTPMYPHQKQALNWMIKQENSQNLPPFWELKNGQYFNTVLNYQSKDKPDSVRGGILADDMGLGKTLEMIALILTNFVDGKPLAVPVGGIMRRRKSLQDSSLKSKYSSSHQSEDDCYLKEPIKDKKKRSIMPELPSLPEGNDNVDTLDTSEDEGEPAGLPELDTKLMLKNDDPDFSPKIKAKSKRKQTKQASTVACHSRRTKKKPARYTYSSEEHEEGDEIQEVKPKETGPKANWKELEETQGTCTWQRSARKRPAKNSCHTNSIEKDELISEETPRKKVKSVKNDECKATAKSISEKKNFKSGLIEIANNPPAEKKPNKLQLTRKEKENHDKTNNSNNTSVKSDVIIKHMSDLAAPAADPGIPTVIPNYTKPGEAVYGAATGRTPTNGPRATLIVCPLSVLSNWLDQFETHVSPFVHLNIYLYYGTNREKKTSVISQQDVVLTTYSTLANDAKTKGAQSPLKKVQWLRIVLDEGHAIKNPNSQQTKAICELQAVRKWVLTGTPIQNSMKDLWSLINFLKINPFTDKQWWRRTIERPLEKGEKTALVRVQHLMANIAMRRTKMQKVNGKPIVELPKREIYIEHVKFSEEEKTVYEAMQNDGKVIISKYFKQGTLLHNYGDVLAILMRLRQLCCHPFLVAKAAEAVKETLGDIEKNGGLISDELREKLIGRLVMVLGAGTDEECAICLESLNVPVITHCAHVFCRPCIEAVIKNERPTPRCPLCRGSIELDKLLEVPPEELNGEEDGSKGITSENWKSSAKCDALMNALLKLRTEDDSVKSIVVSQFTSLLTLLEIPLRANGFNFVRFDGSLTPKARTEAIEAFSKPNPNAPTIFLMSLKAGGVGINLTAASRVFLLDPAWNPASEDQCFDRCHRLGQTKDVVITKFIVEDSVEERMLELQDKKRQLMQGAFSQKLTGEEKRQARIKDIKCLLDL